ncbi:MAG: menaquinone biosynthesis protein [Bacteroidales bacterium]|jgi:chorismate dehydratase|nr:menaquinone biosynthesis protein [Bacteroidales bacterium]
MHPGKIRVSAVKYANTYPFMYGLSETGFDKKVELSTDHPADCAAKLISGRVDIGLIPVAALPMMKEYHIITDYCLGAYGKVRTVMLLSNYPFEEIRTINLDYRSRSSVSLARILAKNSWKKEFFWNRTSENFDFINLPEYEAAVLIGDQCFEYENRFKFRIDLAEEWYKFTGLPFAFACWTSNIVLEEKFLSEFNDALRTGLENIPAVIEKYGKSGVIRGEDLRIYLTHNMSFDLNDDKRKAIKLFLELLSRL